MISNDYEKPSLQLVDFSVEEVLTSSSVVTTTTTVPGSTTTTDSGIHVVDPGSGGGEDITIPWSDLFRN